MPKPVKPLTTTQVENARWKEGGSNKRFDGGGMFLLLTPEGTKLWRLKYRRPANGKENLLSLGRYPEMSLAKARKRREECRAQLADGVDPGEARKAEKREAALRDANSFESVAREWYGKREQKWVPQHAADVLRRLESNLFPEIGAKPIAEITALVLLAAVQKIEHRGALDLAHRVLGVAGQIFRYGVATGRCDRNPAADLRDALTPHTKKNQAAVPLEELPELLKKVAGYGGVGDRQTALAMQLLALTFVRTGELIGAAWDEIDLEGKTWIVPAERMKMKADHVVPLSKQALHVLEELRAIAGGSRYVFPGRNPDKPMSNNTILFALYRLGFKGRMTGHGFRSVASTILNESGEFRPDVIERQLAHCERNDVRGAYNRAVYLPERQAMMQQYADMLDSLVAGAKVIPTQRVATK